MPKLSILPNVLFDEFPNDENYKTIKFCIFTQPKYPENDCTKYKGVKYCCTEDTFHVLGGFKKIPREAFLEEFLDQRLMIFRGTTQFKIRAIPSGHVSKSVMLLIYIEDKIHLYTGQFTECRDVVLGPIALHYKGKLNDLYVDNTMANFRANGLRFGACNRIRDIVGEHGSFKIYLQMELFGSEEILFELARDGMKIAITTPQKVLFGRCNLGELFEFDGLPQLKVYAYIRETKPLSQQDYEKLYDEHKIIHIKLVPMEHHMKPEEQIRGLFLVSYTPHATSHILHTLFQTLEPKRVFPLVPQGFSDALMSTIPEDILNNGCEVVDYIEWGGADIQQNDIVFNDDDDDISLNVEEHISHSERSFLDLSEEFQDSSVEMDDLSLQMKIIHEGPQPNISPKKSIKQNAPYKHNTIQNISRIVTDHKVSNDMQNQPVVDQISNSKPNQPIEERVEKLPATRIGNTPVVISDDEEDENDNILGLCMESNCADTTPRNLHRADLQLNEKEDDRSVQNQTVNDAVQSNQTNNNEVVEKAVTTAETKSTPNLNQTSVIHKQIESKKIVRTKFKTSPSRFKRLKQIEYLSDSDDEENLNLNFTNTRNGDHRMDENETGIRTNLNNENEQNENTLEEDTESYTEYMVVFPS